MSGARKTPGERAARLLAYETRLAAVAVAVAGVLLIGCGLWVCTGRPPGHAQGDLAHAGLIDVAATALLALAFTAASEARRTALRALRRQASQ
jgi:hypothetical protein